MCGGLTWLRHNIINVLMDCLFLVQHRDSEHYDVCLSKQDGRYTLNTFRKYEYICVCVCFLFLDCEG
jgi:hypothetical protein